MPRPTTIAGCLAVALGGSGCSLLFDTVGDGMGPGSGPAVECAPGELRGVALSDRDLGLAGYTVDLLRGDVWLPGADLAVVARGGARVQLSGPEVVVALDHPVGQPDELSVHRYAGSGWSDELVVGEAKRLNSSGRPFDLVTGELDGLLVYEVADNVLRSRRRAVTVDEQGARTASWDAEEEAVQIPGPTRSGPVLWVVLASDPDSERVLLTYQAGTTLFAALWSGTRWDQLPLVPVTLGVGGRQQFVPGWAGGEPVVISLSDDDGVVSLVLAQLDGGAWLPISTNATPLSADAVELSLSAAIAPTGRVSVAATDGSRIAVHDFDASATSLGDMVQIGMEDPFVAPGLTTTASPIAAAHGASGNAVQFFLNNNADVGVTDGTGGLRSEGYGFSASAYLFAASAPDGAYLFAREAMQLFVAEGAGSGGPLEFASLQGSDSTAPFVEAAFSGCVPPSM